MCRLLQFTLTSLLFAGPALAVEPPAEITQWSGQHSGVAVAATRVIRSTEAWQAFWRQVRHEPPRPLEAEREMAVVVFLGERRTGGYSAKVVEVRKEQAEVVIEYHEIRPPPGVIVSQALTSPWVATVVPKSELPVITRSRAGAKPAEK